MLKEVLKKLEGDNCGLSLEEDSDFEGDGTYGYMPETDTGLAWKQSTIDSSTIGTGTIVQYK